MSRRRIGFTLFHETLRDTTNPSVSTQRMLTHAQKPSMLQTQENVVVRHVFEGFSSGIHTDEVTGSNPVSPTLL